MKDIVRYTKHLDTLLESGFTKGKSAYVKELNQTLVLVVDASSKQITCEEFSSNDYAKQIRRIRHNTPTVLKILSEELPMDAYEVITIESGQTLW